MKPAKPALRPNALAAIPSVDRLLQEPRVRERVAELGHELVTAELRAVLEQQRGDLRARNSEVVSLDELVEKLMLRLQAATRASLRRVFNLTGTVLHTNLGRALLPPAAAEAARAASVDACTLEFDLAEGKRGDRDEHLEALICRLTGAEAATVVNNNAAAVLLALNTVAKGKEVLVSRGELVEIGGSFRIPEIVESAGCRLREVGTTNRTHLRDFERAIDAHTAALLKVHTSNYAVVGFVASPEEAELARLAHAKGLPYVTDLGSGSLVDLEKWGLPREPTVAQALSAGADLVTFSGDKLLGGPQAGILAGSRELIGRVRANPLKRALRVDKGRIAALEAVLRLYLDPQRLAQRLPTLRLLTRNPREIEHLAQRLEPALQAFCGAAFVADVAPCSSQIGSGSLPVERLPSAALRVRLADDRASSEKLQQLVSALRELPVPVIGRVHAGALWLDLRCLEDEAGFAAQLRERNGAPGA